MTEEYLNTTDWHCVILYAFFTKDGDSASVAVLINLKDNCKLSVDYDPADIE